MDTNDKAEDHDEAREAAALEAFREQHFKTRRLRILLILTATIALAIGLKWVQP